MTILRSSYTSQGSTPRVGFSGNEDDMLNTKIPERIVKPWKLPKQQVYIFQNANVVDPVEGKVHENVTVKIADGIIESVVIGASSPDANQHGDEADGIGVDLTGKFLCPGLIDCHVHLSSVPGSADLASSLNADPATSFLRQPFACAATLRRGFTTVRDCGGATLALKEALDDDVFPGPRLFFAGRALSQTGGHGDRRGAHEDASPTASCCGGGEGAKAGLAEICDGVPACVRAAREQLRRGADFIKIMVGGGVASPTDRLTGTQFTGEEVRAICEVARGSGVGVTAHAYTPAAVRHAVDNGVGGIEHGNLIDAETAEYLATRGVWLTPTLVTYEALGGERYRGYLPEVSRRKNERYILAQGLRSLQLAAEAGVTMCFGTDLLGPLTAEQPREFGIRARVLSAADVLRSATVNAAAMLRQEGFLGQIKPGFAADLLVLAADPLSDVAVLDEPDKVVLAVVKNGRVYCSRWEGLGEDV
ncbi:amidohydrolase [Biscogniauxia sp. FL1348]|nr:amidohydrolase [Biscogniauxia sp. FL1348]